MKILLLSLLLLAGALTGVAQAGEAEGLRTPEQERESSGKQMERERGDAAAEHFDEELRDAPTLESDGNPADIDPVPPLISPGSPTIVPTPSPAPAPHAPRLPGESERDMLAPDSGN